MIYQILYNPTSLIITTQDETLRIEGLGGSVQLLRGVWRVNLTLSVARAIGINSVM